MNTLQFNGKVYTTGIKHCNSTLFYCIIFVHSAYKLPFKDAMGASIFPRGFSDSNLYVAYNTQEKITPVKVRQLLLNYHVFFMYLSYIDSAALLTQCRSVVCPV